MARYGIDFGTCTSSIAVSDARGSSMIFDGTQRAVIPSVVAHTPSGRTEIGFAAKARRLIDPDNSIHSMKRLLGRTWRATETHEFRHRYPFAMVGGEDALPRFITRQGQFTAGEVTAQFIQAMRLVGELQPDKKDITCLAVPVAFDASQRNAAIEAVKTAGFQHIELLDEPVAAAIEYAAGAHAAERIAVYDLGGGTFDFAVLALDGKKTTLLASGGNDYLGGDDIDLRVAEWVNKQVLEIHQWDLRTSSATYAGLLQACERVKIRLSEVDETSLALGQIEPVLQGKEVVLKRKQLEALSLDLVQRTFITVDEVMRQAGVSPHELNQVVIAGGCGFIPCVRAYVQRYFGVKTLVDRPNDRVVALGALRYAETLA